MFDICCLARGWPLTAPVAECNPGFDRIILREGALVRVQIKGITGSRFCDGEMWTLGGSFNRLNTAGFDEMAIVDVDSATMWLIPVSEVMHKFHPCQYLNFETHILSLADTPPGEG
jgi:hypothetical protein